MEKQPFTCSDKPIRSSESLGPGKEGIQSMDSSALWLFFRDWSLSVANHQIISGRDNYPQTQP
jgi:hypothetical protein